MREIKFRGKSLNTNAWVYGDLRQDKIRKKAYIEYEVDPSTIGQYTGLKDKNGKKIYEGDIVSSGDTKGIVMYDCEQAGFVVQKEKSIELRFYSLLGIEVIGNIHDNHGLIKCLSDSINDYRHCAYSDDHMPSCDECIYQSGFEAGWHACLKQLNND